MISSIWWSEMAIAALHLVFIIRLIYVLKGFPAILKTFLSSWTCECRFSAFTRCLCARFVDASWLIFLSHTAPLIFSKLSFNWCFWEHRAMLMNLLLLLTLQCSLFSPATYAYTHPPEPRLRWMMYFKLNNFLCLFSADSRDDCESMLKWHPYQRCSLQFLLQLTRIN